MAVRDDRVLESKHSAAFEFAMDEREFVNSGLVHDLVASSALRWPNHVAVHFYKDGPISSAASHAQGEAVRTTPTPFSRRWGCSHLRLLSLRTCSV